MKPILFETQWFFIPTYLLTISLAFSIGIVWVYFRAAKFKMDQNQVLDAMLASMIGGFIGARLMHVIFEAPGIYLRDPLRVLQFWYGGFVFYGGAVGAILAAFIWTRFRKIELLPLMDLVAPTLGFGYALGRLGCLAAGCCYGTPTDLPWGIAFPEGVEAPMGVSLHPTQIYGMLAGILIGCTLLTLEKNSKWNYPGRKFGMWLMLHGSYRVILEQFRGDFRGDTLFNLSVSTWLSVLAVLGGLHLIRGKN